MTGVSALVAGSVDQVPCGGCRRLSTSRTRHARPRTTRGCCALATMTGLLRQRAAAFDVEHLAGRVAGPHQVEIGLGRLRWLTDPRDELPLRHLGELRFAAVLRDTVP